MSEIPVNDLLQSNDPVTLVKNRISVNFTTDESEQLLSMILHVLPEIDRFQIENGREHWILQISMLEDESIEFIIRHNLLDFIVLDLTDEDILDEEELLDHICIESIYISDYQEFISDSVLPQLVIDELRYWEMDSNYHAYAIEHVMSVFNERYNLAPFGGRKDISIEFSFDDDEIFVGAIDDEGLDNPDYNLDHEHFDIENPVDSIELGIQDWTDVEEEDSDWDADEEWEDETIDEWDEEVEVWEPDIDEDD